MLLSPPVTQSGEVRQSSAEMGLRDLVMGRPSCAAPGSSSSNPLSSFVDAFIGYSPKTELKKELSASAVLLKASFDLFKAVPLSTVPGDENEFKLDQGSVRTMKGTDFVKGHHGDPCGEIFQASILTGPELTGIEPHFHETDQTDSAISMNSMPIFYGPPEMDVPHPLRRSPNQPDNVWAHQYKEHFQELVNRSMDYIDVSYDNEMRCPRKIPHPQMEAFWNELRKLEPKLEQAQLAKGRIGGTDITNMVILAQSHTLEHNSALDDLPQFQGLVVSNDEVSGGWLSLFGIALNHLGGFSQPRFWDEPIKWQEQVIGHRVWIELRGLQERSGWSVVVEATRKSLFDALQDGAMLAVITMRLHFPIEFRGTPFTVLPMVPGQRSKLDYPAIGGGVEAATFMGINYDDVLTLQRERFAAYRHERWECSDALEKYIQEKRHTLAVAKMMVEGLPPSVENHQRIADLLDMGKIEGNFIPGDCGWSVLVSNKAQPQVEPSHQEEKPPSTASSPAVSVRARL